MSALQHCSRVWYILLLFLVTWLDHVHGIVRTRSCTLPEPYNMTPDWPIFDNVSGPGLWTTNKSMVVRWTPSYLRSRDVEFPCNGKPSSVQHNPLNLASRSMIWRLNCNHPNLTNGSVVFYNFTVAANTFSSPIPAVWLVDLTIVRDNGTALLPSLTALRLGPVNSSKPYTFAYPNPLIVTRNATENSTLNITLYPLYTNTMTYPQAYMFNVSTYFECDVYQYIVIVTPDDSSSFAVLLAFLIPLALILLIGALAFLRYKYPNLCKCGDDKKEDPHGNNRSMSPRGPASQPMMTINDKAGMATWLDQAEDVVADLNKTQLYLAEAQPDKDPNTNNNLESLVANSAAAAPSDNKMDAHKDGFVGGRKVFAAGGAAVQQKDHKVTMAVKPVEDDFL